MMKQTSVRAYKSISQSGELSKRKRQVLKAVKKFGPATAREIYSKIGKPGVYSGYQPRFTELQRAGLIKEVGKRPCQITGRQASLWNVPRREVVR